MHDSANECYGKEVTKIKAGKESPFEAEADSALICSTSANHEKINSDLCSSPLPLYHHAAVNTEETEVGLCVHIALAFSRFDLNSSTHNQH